MKMKIAGGKVGKWESGRREISPSHFPTGSLSRLTITGLLVGVLLSLHVVPPGANAADLSTGYTFSSGEQNVTHTKLNNQVNNATIVTGFYTDKSATTTVADADLLLLYSASAAAFRKITAANLLLSNRGIITNQTVDATPDDDDYIVTYDVSGEALKRATLRAAVFENDALLHNRTNYSTPAGDNFYLTVDGTGTNWSKTARSNLWYQFWNYRTSDFTNLATHTAATNADALVVWSSLHGTNRQLPLINLFSNANWQTSINSTDAIPMVVAGSLAAVPVSTFSNYVLTVVTQYTGAARFTSGLSNLNDGAVIEVAHGLGGLPDLVRYSLVCTNAEDGFAVGDYVDLGALNMQAGDDDSNPFLYGVNATNVFVYCSDPTGLRMKDKTTPTASATLTATNWNVQVTAVRF